MQEELLLKLIDFKGNKLGGSQSNSDSNNLDIVTKVQKELSSTCLKEASFISDNESNNFTKVLTEDNIAKNINILNLLTKSSGNLQNQTGYSPSNNPTQPNPHYSNYANMNNYGNTNYGGNGYNYNIQNYNQNNQNYYQQQTGMNSSPSNNYPYQKKKTKGLFEFGQTGIDLFMSKFNF